MVNKLITYLRRRGHYALSWLGHLQTIKADSIESEAQRPRGVMAALNRCDGALVALSVGQQGHFAPPPFSLKWPNGSTTLISGPRPSRVKKKNHKGSGLHGLLPKPYEVTAS
jgi:hypothetical protein